MPLPPHADVAPNALAHPFNVLPWLQSTGSPPHVTPGSTPQFAPPRAGLASAHAAWMQAPLGSIAVPESGASESGACASSVPPSSAGPGQITIPLITTPPASAHDPKDIPSHSGPKQNPLSPAAIPLSVS